MVREEAAMDITLRLSTFDDATLAWMQAEARRTGLSLEAVVERLVQRGIAAERQAAHSPPFHDLDALAGTWSAEQAAEFEAAIADFERVDSTLWK
jgi:hypothetical protein